MTMQSVLIGVQRENLFSTIFSVTAFGFESATAIYGITGGREVSITVEDGVPFSGESDWLVPNQFGYNYEVRATLTSGFVDGTFNTFIAADSNPTWRVDVFQFGDVNSGTISLDFRRKGDTNILLTKTVSLQAEAS